MASAHDHSAENLTSGTSTADATSSDPGTGGGPGGNWASRGHIYTIAGYQVLLASVALYVMLKLLPLHMAADAPARGAAEGAVSINQPVVSADSAPPGFTSAIASAVDSPGQRPVVEAVEATAGGDRRGAACASGLASEIEPPSAATDPACVSLFTFTMPVWKQQRLLVLVLLAGLLGAVFRGLGSVALYVGTRMLRESWLLQYYVQPIRGAVLGLLFYLLFRGGLFSSTASFDSTDSVGFMALAALVGLFEKEATAKLQQIAAALFAPHEQNVERAQSGTTASGPIATTSPAPSSTPAVDAPLGSTHTTQSTVVPALMSVDPTELLAGDQPPAAISVLGTNLNGATFSISRDGMEKALRQVEHVSDTTVQVTLLPEDVATPGRLYLQATLSAAGTSNTMEIEVLDANANLP